MSNGYLKTLENFKRAATCGIILGFVLFITGIFANAFNGGSYAISAAGIGVTIASMVLFGFGMCLSLMEELNEKNPRTYP
ncbi:hypothetical protein [Bacillus sp. 1NLA3E]|uniref:hypothetical protein n=1 Tax=Bacillus sp. 1NLA3E TaxID=666686 RepID=UPI000247E39B|nr:hypothetical protein [Bacillus sp. 1NLA3E]AGK52621.1 hypothetical protein B1NLA3E_04225 [Bacillus sp. 1NLA3E]